MTSVTMIPTMPTPSTMDARRRARARRPGQDSVTTARRMRCVGMTRATPSSDDDGERDGFGRDAGVWARARFVTRDAKTRLALPGNGSPQVGERPFSDQVFGFAFCVATFLALGRVDDFFVSVRGVPFMISSWASLAVLAFGTVDAPPLRLWNVVVGQLASAAIALVCVGAFGTGSHVARAMALSVSLTVMMRLGAIHPPAGAVAFAAVDGAYVEAFGLWYVLFPALAGSLFIVCMSEACQWMKKRFEFELSDVASAFARS